MDMTLFLVVSIIFIFGVCLGDLIGSRRQMKHFIAQKAQEENNRLWQEQLQSMMEDKDNDR